MPSDTSRGHNLWTGVAIILVCAVWYVVTSGPTQSLALPSPVAVIRAARATPNLPSNMAVTWLRVLTGLTSGALAGVYTALALAWSPKSRALLLPIVEIARPLPPIALVPFFILWLGTASFGQILLIAISVFMVMLVTTMTAIATVSPTHIRCAKLFGASKREISHGVLLPAASPEIFGGIRVAAAMAFGIGVAAEFMGAQSGLGYMIMVARRTLHTETILLATILIGLESYATDWTIRIIRDHKCRWAEQSDVDINTFDNTKGVTW